MTDLKQVDDARQLNAVLGWGLGSTPAAGDSRGPPEAVAQCCTFPSRLQRRQQSITQRRRTASMCWPARANAQLAHKGTIDLLAHRLESRPAPGGDSIGCGTVGAGTLGCLRRGCSGPRYGRTLALSNNHVLADVNPRKLRGSIYQTGPLDGGTSRANVLESSERFVPIQFTGLNYLDCATALVDSNDVRKGLVRLVHGMPQPFQITPAAFRRRSA